MAEATGVQIDRDLAERLADEQLRMVWMHASIGTLIATAFAVFMAVHLSDTVPVLLVQTWVVMKLLVAIPRIVQAQVYRRQGYPGGQAWRSSTYWMLALDGAVWGLAGAWLMQQDTHTASLVAACLACVASVATFGLQVRVLATAAYVAPMLAPTALSLLWRGDEFGLLGGIGLVLMLGLLLTTALRSEKRLAEVFLLRLHANRIAQERAQALEMAQRESAVKSQFLATMSHELRTPLHGILGLARLLHVDTKDPAMLRRIELIESSGTHLLSLINDLLDIARIESGQLKIQCTTFDLAAELERVAGVYAVRAEDKGLVFTSDLRLPRPCWVQGDPARMRQVLHNLLGNAVKFTQKGWVGLAVHREPDDETVVFEVRDTGVGIAPADQAHIFDAFRQVAAGPSRPLEGTGLGLTIAREIAHAMGGDITCQSTVGVGSLFRFTARLPSVAAPALESAAPVVPAGSTAVTSAAVTPAAAASGQRQPHVLLVEDNDLNALVASAFLERCGLEVEHVHDGREAVRHALREVGRPDLILMDCLMPTLDGFEATREIRHQEQALGLARVPVIALTATASEEDRRRCLAAGMDDFLAKPFTDADLMALMSVWLPPWGKSPGAPAAPPAQGQTGHPPSLGGKGFQPT
ncbi:ATP-binding protein [Caldimonas taiwanensis]|uniref:ATP-binding protein n=1 Tax=Caldimonas taiwanensis TaxID=307483 RepID=UPI000B16F92A|nr:ATP-binding protein [Caldimonas taiwanensis]